MFRIIPRATEIGIKLSILFGLFLAPPKFSSKAIYQLLESMGCVYIKLGQLLTYQPIDEEIKKELNKLMYEVKPFSTRLAERIVERSIGEKLKLRRIATASISQVHVDEYGRIVKVRKPGIKKEVETDLKILEYVKDFIPTTFISSTVDLLKEALPQELDFRKEAKNIEDMRFLSVKVPEVYAYSEDVIILERIKGFSAVNADKLSNEARIEAFKELGRAVIESIFSGIVHGDPSPGNVIINKYGKVGLVDFGLVWRAGEKEKNVMRELYTSMLSGDWDSIENIINTEILKDGDIKITTKPSDAISALFSDKNIVEDLIDEGVRKGIRVRTRYLVLVKSILQWLKLSKNVLGKKPDEKLMIEILPY